MASLDQIIELPLDLLPDDSSQRNSLLAEYFPDKRCEAFKLNGSWKVTLRWPTTNDLLKDPRIHEGFANLFGGSIPETIGSVRPFRRGSFNVCLNDSWTLLDWSKAQVMSTDEKLVIVHIDAHSDLMPPLLELEGDQGFKDLLTGKSFSLSCQQSVASAIDSGAIGIGSFIVPFLWQANCEALIHICNAEYAPEIRGWGKLVKGTCKTPPFPLAERPNVKRSVDSKAKGIPHLVTDDLSKGDVDLKGKTVLLHFDLDYFNNRINGDSHWYENTDRHDPSIDNMLSRLNSLSSELIECGLDNCIAVTAACSPEFCPGELWTMLLDAIEDRFAKII